ncbi:Oncosphere antigen B [Taenia solium]
MALPFYLILLATSVFARGFGSNPGVDDLWNRFSTRRNSPDNPEEVLPDVKGGLTTELPKYFHWNRVGSRSVELGWDVNALAKTKAEEIKLTANYYIDSVSYRYRTVSIWDRKVTFDGLKPSTFYEMVVRGLEKNEPIFTHTVYIKTAAKVKEQCTILHTTHSIMLEMRSCTCRYIPNRKFTTGEIYCGRNCNYAVVHQFSFFYIDGEL